MVRLSLIVLGLLAAVWCFSGTTECKVRARIIRGNTLFNCRRDQKIKVEKCYRIRSSCPRVTYSSSSVKCLSKGSAGIVKKCNKKTFCWVSGRISKGPYACKYRCVRKPRPRNLIRCHGYMGRRLCHRYRKFCRTRGGRRRCGLFRRKCYRRLFRRRRCRWIPRCHRTRFRRYHCHGRA